MSMLEDAGKGSVVEAEKVAIPELEQKAEQLVTIIEQDLRTIIDYAINKLAGKRVVISIEDKP